MEHNNKCPIIIGLGELLWDILPTGKKAGGAPINFVFHASQMGAESYAVTAIGKDPLGDEILAELEKASIKHIIERIDRPTGTVLVTLKDGIPEYEIIENVAWDFIPMTDKLKEIAQKADAICFGTLGQRAETSMHTIQKVLQYAPESCYKIFDINIRQHFYSKELIIESLGLSNVFKINDDELKILQEMFPLQDMDEDTICNWFVKKFNLRYMILTAGDQYSKIYTNEEMSYLETPKVKVVDTVGAGDSFTGAFITSILKGKSLRESHEIAVKQAAYVCTQSGAWVK